MDEINL